MSSLTFVLSFETEKFENEFDALKASTFTLQQRVSLTNTLRQAMEEKVNMSVEVPNYLYKQEYLRGQIDILAHILSVDEAAKSRLDEMEREV